MIKHWWGFVKSDGTIVAKQFIDNHRMRELAKHSKIIVSPFQMPESVPELQREDWAENYIRMEILSGSL